MSMPGLAGPSDNKVKQRSRSNHEYARMAELVDALVSNTSGSDAVPVRSRLRVRKQKKQIFGLFLFFCSCKSLVL